MTPFNPRGIFDYVKLGISAIVIMSGHKNRQVLKRCEFTQHYVMQKKNTTIKKEKREMSVLADLYESCTFSFLSYVVVSSSLSSLTVGCTLDIASIEAWSTVTHVGGCTTIKVVITFAALEEVKTSAAKESVVTIDA